VWLVAAAITSGQTFHGDRSQLSPSIARFLDSSGEPLTQFRARRHLEATNARFKKHGWMDVITELSPERGFTFHIVDEGGSEYIRKKVLRPILDGERDVIVRGEAARAALTLDNYDMLREEPAADGLVRVILRPKRQERLLIDGALFVTGADADLVRVSGRLAKNPSFWMKRVDVIRSYGRVAGVRVPLSVESTAQVRIAGPSVMTMSYRYELVNGRAAADKEIAGD
jgi:hypothetical protein